MNKIADWSQEPRVEDAGQEQLWEMVYRICERHGIPQKAERTLPHESSPGKERL
jgi:hypothetical protein